MPFFRFDSHPDDLAGVVIYRFRFGVQTPELFGDVTRRGLLNDECSKLAGSGEAHNRDPSGNKPAGTWMSAKNSSPTVMVSDDLKEGFSAGHTFDTIFVAACNPS